MKQPPSKSLIWLIVAAAGFAIAIGAKMNAAASSTLVDGGLFIGTALFIAALIAFWRSRLDDFRAD
ncbi:MAG: hypothetical protein ACK5ZG_05100 [Phycisphaerae bacterium]|jgi:hypothetical protein